MGIYSDFTDPKYLKNNKVRVILDETGLNASQFADAIGVQRSTISHILAYRNRPSQDVVEKIIAWDSKYSFDWFKKNTPEEEKIILKLIENQGYGGAKVQDVTAQESHEKSTHTKYTATNDSRKHQIVVETPTNNGNDNIKPRRAVLITIVYDDGSSQVIPVDHNSKFNQFLGQ